MLPNAGHGLPAGGYPNKRYIAETVVVNAVATAQTAGVTIQNQTAAAAGAQQYSPMLVLEGQGWKTDATAASQKVEWAFQNRPVQGAANPTSVLDVMSQINSGGWTKPMTLTSAGVLTALVGVTVNTMALTESSGFLSSSGGYIAPAAQGYRITGNLGFLIASGGVTYLSGQGNIGALSTEQANGSTSDRWRIWHNQGTQTAGNLLSWGDGATYNEKGKIDVNGDVFTNANLDKLAAGTLVIGGSTATGVRVGKSGGTLGFYGTTPIAIGASVADATGGATIDAEARTAINALISRIEALGLITTV